MKPIPTQRILPLLAALLLCAALAGCAAQPEAQDFLGNTITLQAQPQRIVSLTPSNTEILYALGLGDKVVGVDALSNYPPEVEDVPDIGDFNGPNLEMIAALEPDLVLAGNKLQADIVAQLGALGLRVAAVEATTYAEIYQSIDMIGKLTGTQTQAQALITDLKAQTQAITDAVAAAGVADVPVYYALSYGEYGNWTAGPGTFIDEMITMTGGVNIAGDAPVQWLDYSLEELVARDPQVLLLSSDMGDTQPLLTADVYKELAAVQNGRVYLISSDIVTRPGPRIAQGLREFAAAIAGVQVQ